MGIKEEKEREIQISCPTYTGPDRRAEEKEHWHTSKSVPISIIFAILFQTVMLIIWASTFRAEFVAHEQRSSERFLAIESRLNETYDKESISTHLQLRDQKIESLSTVMTNLAHTMNRIADKVEKRIDECERRISK